MPIIYNVKTSVIDEGTPPIERKVIKISQLGNAEGIEFIKTYPYLDNFKTRKLLPIIQNEYESTFHRNYIGIGFNIYEYANYIRLFSTYESFPLNAGDYIEFEFEDGYIHRCTFTSANRNIKFMNSNVAPLSDDELAYFAENKIVKWQLTNTEKDYTMVGGFIRQEYNKQYKSAKVGQELFKRMSKEVIATKEIWFQHG